MEMEAVSHQEKNEAALRAERDELAEALRLARGELEVIKSTPVTNEGTAACGHNRYWMSAYGRCMACDRDLAEEREAAALARVKEVERDFDEGRAAQRALIIELQDAMCAVFRHLGPPTNRFTTWREQVIDAIDVVTAERDRLKADNERLRGLLDEAANYLPMQYHHCDGSNPPTECVNELCAAHRGHAQVCAYIDEIAGLVDRIDRELGK